MAKPIYLWEIMVPCYWRADNRPVRTRHHQHWDAVIKKIAGGLTIYKPANGVWMDPRTNLLYKERMIPVRIACTENQIKRIINFTLIHYDQIAVMAYRVSDYVLIINRDDKERKDTTPASIYECRGSNRDSVSTEDK